MYNLYSYLKLSFNLLLLKYKQKMGSCNNTCSCTEYNDDLENKRINEENLLIESKNIVIYYK